MQQDQKTVYDSLEQGPVRSFYENPNTASHVLDIAAQHQLTDAQTGIFVDLVGEAILGMTKIEDMPTILEEAEFPTDVTFTITNDVKAFLAPLTQQADEDASRAAQTFQEVDMEPMPTPAPSEQKPSAPPTTELTPTERTPQPPSGVSELRTMRGDAELIPGYGAYPQRISEKEGLSPDERENDSRLADIPKYSND